MQTLENSANVKTETKATKPDFGHGRYSPLMSEVFEDAQAVFGLSAKTAEKLARNIGTDYGVIMSGGSVGMSKVTLGKIDKNAKLTVKEAATSVKGVSLTNTLYALKALCWAGEAGKNGFKWSESSFVVNDELAKYFKTLEQ